MPRVLTISFSSLLVLALTTACDKGTEVPAGPTEAEKAAAAKAAAEKEAAEKEAAEKAAIEAAAAEYANREYFTLATFNLAWAHDHVGGGPKGSEAQRAQKEEDWEWKVKAIAEVLAEHKPDVVALHELGGSGELSDIVEGISVAKGPEYDWAFTESTDTKTGHQTAILSRFPISNERRLDIHMRRHVLADLELPKNRGTATLVAIHAPEGSRSAVVSARIKQTQILLRGLKKQRAKGPVIIFGTLGSNVTPSDEGYRSSAAGLLSGAKTSKSGDDCDDSSAVGTVPATTSDEKVADRIFSCGLAMRDAQVLGDDKIVRGYVDKWDQPWSSVPVKEDPMRDVSDHFILWSEISLPQPPPKPGEAEKEDEGE